MSAATSCLRRIEVFFSSDRFWRWRTIVDKTNEVVASSQRHWARQGSCTKAATDEAKLYRSGAALVVILEEK